MNTNIIKYKFEFNHKEDEIHSNEFTSKVSYDYVNYLSAENGQLIMSNFIESHTGLEPGVEYCIVPKGTNIEIQQLNYEEGKDPYGGYILSFFRNKEDLLNGKTPVKFYKISSYPTTVDMPKTCTCLAINSVAGLIHLVNYRITFKPIYLNPLYKNDLAINYEKESGQQFFRTKLSGKLTFIGKDYDTIMATPFSEVKYLLVQVSFNNGAYYKDAYKFKFVITDCEIDENKKIISVQPSPDDEYEDILNAYEKEFDLIQDLKPIIHSVKINKTGMLQVYLPGSQVVSCFFNGLTWNAKVTEPVWDEAALHDIYRFGLILDSSYTIKITDQAGNSSGLAGTYWATLTTSKPANGQRFYLNGDTSKRYIEYFEEPPAAEPPRGYRCRNGFKWYSNGYSGYAFYQEIYTSSSSGWYLDLPNTFMTVWGGTGDILSMGVKLFGRWVTDTDYIKGVQCYDIPKDDIVEYNRNYKKCLYFDSAVNDGKKIVTTTVESSAEPTGFQQTQSGRYFVKPTSSIADYFPLYEGYWEKEALWLRFSDDYDSFNSSITKSYMNNYMYPLYSIIDCLLQKITSKVSHSKSAECSTLLYKYGSTDLYITPKSNILVSEFSEPALKGAVSLKMILDMYANVYRIYWFIENGKLRLERLDWFKNGGTYEISDRAISYDLTAIKEPKNKKAWSYFTSSYSFNKDNLPGQFKFSWMDEVTPLFSGYKINIPSPLVAKDTIEEIQVNNFTSDIDYMLLSPNEMSKDGFALIIATSTNNALSTFYTSFIPINRKHKVYLQNGMLAFSYLLNQQVGHEYIIRNGWLDDMPSYTLEVEGITMSASSIRRIKNQEISLPLNDSMLNINVFNLIKTELGNGLLEKLSVKLSTGMATLNLSYEANL